MYSYDLILASPKLLRYSEKIIRSENLPDAVFQALSESLGLIDFLLIIYCRRPLSGDLQLMGTYDGFTAVFHQGLCYRHFLYLKNGCTYLYSETGFVRFFL